MQTLIAIASIQLHHRKAVKILSSFSALMAAILVGAAQAAITSPQDNAELRYPQVIVVEDTGGVGYTTCDSAGIRAYGKITIEELSSGTIVHSETFPDAGGYSSTWDATEAAPGVYKITSIASNVTFTFPSCVRSEEVVLSEITIEYIPWTYSFEDFFSNGGVAMDPADKGFQFRIGDQTSPVFTQYDRLWLYKAPSASTLPAPADIEACAAAPEACLPDAIQCFPESGCTPNLAVIYQPESGNPLYGIFQLESRAFVATGSTGGVKRVMLSLGEEADADTADILDQLDAAAEEHGIELYELLASTVTVNIDNGKATTQVEMSLLEFLQISTLKGEQRQPTSLQTDLPYSVLAGRIQHSYFFLWKEGDVPPSEGYVVRSSNLTPSIPGTGDHDGEGTGAPFLYEVGGPARSVRGTWPAGTGGHKGRGLYRTRPDFSDVGETEYINDTWMDFVGYANVFTTKLDHPDFHLHSGAMHGEGVAIFGTGAPLPVSVGELPLLWEDYGIEWFLVEGAIDFIFGY